jgi:hypothetical protein
MVKMVRQKFHVLSLALALAFQQSLSFAPPVSVLQARDCPLTSRLAARGSICSQKCKGTIFESASATCLRLLRAHGGAAEPKHVIARTKVPGDPKREYEDTYIGARTERTKYHLFGAYAPLMYQSFPFPCSACHVATLDYGRIRLHPSRRRQN